MPYAPRPHNGVFGRRTIGPVLFAMLLSSFNSTHAEPVANGGFSSQPAVVSVGTGNASPAEHKKTWISPLDTSSRSVGSDIRWITTAGLALVLAICGGIGAVARRYLPRGAAGSMKVIGRVGLSPKHAIYMVQVGRRVLVVGTGPQGAPSLISELDDGEGPFDIAAPPSPVPGRRDES